MHNSLGRQEGYYYTPLSFESDLVEANIKIDKKYDIEDGKIDLFKRIKNEKRFHKNNLFKKYFGAHKPNAKISAKDSNKILKEHADLLLEKVYTPYEKYFSKIVSLRAKHLVSIRAYFFFIKFIQQFKIAHNIDLFKIEHIHRFLLQPNSSSSERVGMKDIGFGNQQLLTLLLYITLEIADGEDDRYIIIEEPEANLHPNRQVELVNMLIDYQKEFGVKFILETHSENILRRYQLLIAKGELRSEELNIIFFREKGEAEHININEYGQITVPFGEDFYNKSTNQKLELMEHVRNSTSKRK